MADKDGYGKIKYLGRVHRAHRVALESVEQPSNPDMFACHTCDNPPCVRPDHLFWGTVQDNTRDMISKGRGSTGERHPEGRLTWSKVDEIRAKYATGEFSQQELADRFDVSQVMVSRVVRMKNWKPQNRMPTPKK